MRAFLAYSIPEEIQEELSKLSIGLPNTTWVKQFNFHLTIQFYAELSFGLIQAIQEKLEAINFSKILTKAKGLGKFVHPKGSSVIWLGLENQTQIIQERNKILFVLRDLNLEIDKKFFPHITIGRSKQLNEIRWNSYFETFQNFESSEFCLDSIVLFQSTLSPKGSIYEEIFRIAISK